MRRLRAGLAAAAALALAGCYESDKLLLDASQAATPLATGRQQASGGSSESVEISLGTDRWYRVGGGGTTGRLLFTPLDPGSAAPRYAFAFEQRRGFLYGVAERRDGKLWLDLPFCDLGPAREIAIRHGVGAPEKKAMAPVCSFSDAKALAAALTDYVNRPGPREEVALPAAP